MSFGGRSWPINPLDFNVGQISNGPNPFCQGAIFDLSQGSNNIPGSSSPTWVVGDTFLVRHLSYLILFFFFLIINLEKRVLGVPFLPSLRWVCAVVCCGWWIRCRFRCGILGVVLGLNHHRCCGHGYRTFFSFSYYWALSYVSSFSVWARLFFFYLFPPRIKCYYYVNHILCIPDAFNRHYCCHVMSLNRAGSYFFYSHS